MAPNTPRPVTATKLGWAFFPVGLRATGKSARPAFLVMRDGPSSGQRWKLPLKIFGSLAAISALLYGLGYLISLSYFRMLGVDMLPGVAVEFSNDHIVFRGITFPVLSLLCVLSSARNWRSCILMAVLLMLWMRPVARAAWRRWRPRQFWFERWRRSVPLAQALGLGAAALVLVGISIAALDGSKRILEQDQLLLPKEPSASREEGATRSSLWGSELDMWTLHQEKSGVQRRTLYGMLLVAAVFCVTLWLRLWQGIRRSPNAWLQSFGTFFMIVIGLPVVLQVYQVPILFGYLAPEPKFPRIEVLGDPLQQHSGENDSEPIELFLLGTRGSTAFLYHLESRNLWWTKTEDLLPAKGLEQGNPFHRGAASDANRDAPLPDSGLQAR